ncbi:MAG TPA: serine/threonine-protein kinase [Kofleriaceae bacterium]
MAEDATEHDGAGPTRREGQGDRPARNDERLARGALVGRYVVLDVVGEGGMGVVYAAYDPELDRKVAVKLLQATTGGVDQAWLTREAQAMARVTHPNVIAVFDVGTLPGDRVFVAMELVEGQTLRAWMKAKQRTWREVLPLLYAAGAGLAAAHAVGLVHRDFKPDNVLVGHDGRARVMDFGLARLRRDDELEPPAQSSDASIELRSPLTRDLTEAGHVPGTPAYLAPEVYDGNAADARSDQFAFGVALYEALFGVRPYTKNGARTPRPPPEGSRVPARVQRVAMRAVAADPAARYASLDALLAELAIDPGAMRRRFALGGAAVVLAAAAAFGVTSALRSHGPRCEGAEHRLAGVWDPPAKHAIAAAYAATKKPFAASSYAGVEHALDDYANGWTAAVTDACRATRIRGEQSEDVLSLREACLDQRLAELAALSRLLGQADADIVSKGDRVAYGLEPIAACANTAALLAPDRLPTEPRDQMDKYFKALAEAGAQLVVGHSFAALNAAKRALDIADAQHDVAMRARPLLVRATALSLSGAEDDAAHDYQESVWAAVRGRQDLVAAEAALSVAGVAAGLGRVPEAKLWMGLSRAEAERVGFDHVLEQHSLEVDGFIAVQSNDLHTAVADHEHALAEAVQAYGADSPALWTSEELYAATLAKAGLYAQALPHFERALALHEQSVGADHPDVAVILTSLGVAYTWTGQLDKARDAYARALALREKEFGKTSPMLLVTLNNQADYLRLSGDPAGALQIIERARQIAAATIGDTHPTSHTIETTYAETLTALHRYADARAAFDALLALEDRTHSAMLAETQASRAELAVDEHDWPTAVDFANKSIAAFEVSNGKDNGMLWRPLVALGRARLGLAQPVDAKAALERAIAIGEQAKVKSEALAPARAALADLARAKP